MLTQDKANELKAALGDLIDRFFVSASPPPDPDPDPDPKPDPDPDPKPDPDPDPDPEPDPDPDPSETIRTQTLMVHHHREDVGKRIIIQDIPPTDPDKATTGVMVHAGGHWVCKDSVIESENPQGTRGHIMVMGDGYAELDGVTLRGMGRTTTAPLGDKNPIGRYGFHWHHAQGPRNHTGEFQGRFDNGHITDSPKWGLSVHRASWMSIQNNLVENCIGSGIVSEDGDEFENLIANNTIRWSRGNGLGANPDSRAAADFGFEGAGLWLASPWNIVDGNIIEDCNIGTQLFLSGANGKGRRPLVNVPKFRGASLTNSAEFTTVDLRDWQTFQKFPVRPVKNSIIRRCNVAHEFWDVAAAAVLVEGSQISDCGSAFNSQFTKHPRMRNCTVRSTKKLLVHNPGYLDSVVLSDIDASLDVVGLELYEGVGYTKLERCKLNAPKGIFYQRLPQRQVTLHSVNTTYSGVILESPAFTPNTVRPEWSAFFVPHRFVFQDDLNPDGNFEVYWPEQHPDYVPPSSGGQFAGSPQPGLTNRELQAKFGFSMFGYMMPDDAVPHPQIPGAMISRTIRPMKGGSASVRFGTRRIHAGRVEMVFDATVPVKPLAVLRSNPWTYHPVEGTHDFSRQPTFQVNVHAGSLSALFVSQTGELIWAPVFYGL